MSAEVPPAAGTEAADLRCHIEALVSTYINGSNHVTTMSNWLQQAILLLNMHLIQSPHHLGVALTVCGSVTAVVKHMGLW
jgi:hypothetical protein